MFKEIDTLISEIMDKISNLEKAYYTVNNAKHLVNEDYLELLSANNNSLQIQYKALKAFRDRFKITYGLKEENIL